MSNRAGPKADVLQGTLDLMVLQTLDSLGPLHGYAIAARLEQLSSGALQLNMGTLDPALMRLEQRGPCSAGSGALQRPIARRGFTSGTGDVSDPEFPALGLARNPLSVSWVGNV